MFVYCSKCKSVATVPIAYGKPGPEMQQAADFGLIRLGGCVIMDADRYCRACGHEWFSGQGDAYPPNERQIRDEICASDLKKMIDQLKKELGEIQRDIARNFIALGRNPKKIDVPSIIANISAYYCVWLQFTYRLQCRGNRTIVIDAKGKICARYDNLTLQIYVLKHLEYANFVLTETAQDNCNLGSASQGIANYVDDLKSASAAYQRACDAFENHYVDITKRLMDDIS